MLDGFYPLPGVASFSHPCYERLWCGLRPQVKGLPLQIGGISERHARGNRIVGFQQVPRCDPRAVADENGNAEFALDRTGRFWMSPEGTVGGWTQIELEVSDKAGLSTVEMTWPGQGKWHPILQTAHLRGHITTGLSSSHSIPLQDNPLILRAALDYTPIATTRTKKDGSFEFADVAPGLYFVQIVSTPEQGRWALRGDIPLYVATTARETLAISTEFTSCGLNYDLEENKSRHQPVACSKGGKLVPCE
jgi:hypothetical protein